MGDVSLTVTGELLGTIRYMSPEQALAKRVPVGHRTDVYALGATLCEPVPVLLEFLRAAGRGRRCTRFRRHSLPRRLRQERDNRGWLIQRHGWVSPSEHHRRLAATEAAA